MPLKTYIENDPQVRRIILFSQSCYALAVAITAMSFTQLMFNIKNLSSNIDTLDILFPSFSCVFFSFCIGIAGARSTNLIKNIKIADIAKRLDEDLEDYQKSKKTKQQQERIEEIREHIDYGFNKITFNDKKNE